MSQRFTHRIRKQVLDRLTDDTYGFNATMAQLAVEPEYAGTETFDIDFSGESDNFWQGAISQDELAATSRKAPQTMIVYTQQSVNNDEPKYQIFGGSISTIIEVGLSWTDNQARHDFETPTDLVEEVLLRVFNRVEGPVMPNYTGKLEIFRGPVVPSNDDNWERTLRFSLPFFIEVQN